MPSLESDSSHGTNAVEVLSTFPYHSNYVDLTALELHALSSAIDLHHVRKIAFIGSGPLPLSSLCLLQQLPSQSCKAGRDLTAAACPDNDAPRVSILNIDREAEAIHLSRALTEKLGPAVAKSMRFVCAAVGDSSTSTLAELQTCDVVFVAALVGTSAEEKTHILERVAAGMRGGSLMVVRTAKGLKGLLYPVRSPVLYVLPLFWLSLWMQEGVTGHLSDNEELTITADRSLISRSCRRGWRL